MALGHKARDDLYWWLNNIQNMYAPIQKKPITKQMTTDASKNKGWGAAMEEISIGGAWKATEFDLDINIKEMIAVYYSIRSFKDRLKNTHTRVLTDNTTAVAVINKMGTTHNDHCNRIAQDIWTFCKKYDIWITCAHIPGVENVIADFESRKEYKQAEWMLNKLLFHKICKKQKFYPNMDCFASRINTQMETYASFQPDPYATCIDAFSFNWTCYKCYVFPPFSLIPRVLQKIRVDRATVLCVVPKWPTQTWWPFLRRMMTRKHLDIKPSKQNLILPNHPQEIHPLHQKMHLIACVLSGDTTNQKD